MLDEERDLLVLKGAMLELAPEEQAKVNEAAERLRAIVNESDHAMMAMAIVTMEIAIERAKELSA